MSFRSFRTSWLFRSLLLGALLITVAECSLRLYGIRQIPLYRTDERYEYIYLPYQEVRPRGVLIKTNDLGLRSPTLKKKKGKRVLVIGDSVINGSYKINQDSTPVTSQTAADLQLNISLNPDLQNDLSPATAVFIFVRAEGIPGPPLAAVRTTVGELPFEIALNDSHAMIAGRTISSASNVIVGARVSVSGNPERQPGDYEQLSDPIPADFNRTVDLVISEII